ncbi:MAG TPA: hypothetical protein PLE75_02765 [Ferruginibacter sp.]|nr:hypothetical protein [Ferruginibacter sp.]HRO05581.1 hypothetical protein [Ferruginibacter sp.]HRO97212.1 hypothetical protein [Ferruginibacter sp.]HRP49375.1 hypothetical protein [Ferruginibacter sp.]
MLNIIHLSKREDRLALLKDQLIIQGISDYKLWEGIVDKSNPAKGISKAHKQIVAWAKKEKLKSIVIAEDDVKFTAKGAYNYFIKNKPTQYDLYLGGIYYGKIKEDHTVSDFAGMMLYIIHERFYDVFLSVHEESDIDRSLANKGTFVVCNPFVAIQHEGYSDNKKAFVNYDICLKGRKLFE